MRADDIVWNTGNDQSEMSDADYLTESPLPKDDCHQEAVPLKSSECTHVDDRKDMTLPYSGSCDSGNEGDLIHTKNPKLLSDSHLIETHFSSRNPHGTQMRFRNDKDDGVSSSSRLQEHLTSDPEARIPNYQREDINITARKLSTRAVADDFKTVEKIPLAVMQQDKHMVVVGQGTASRRRCGEQGATANAANTGQKDISESDFVEDGHCMARPETWGYEKEGTLQSQPSEASDTDESGGSLEVMEGKIVRCMDDHDTDEGFHTCDDCDSVLTRLSRKSSIEALDCEAESDVWDAQVPRDGGRGRTNGHPVSQCRFPKQSTEVASPARCEEKQDEEWEVCDVKEDESMGTAAGGITITPATIFVPESRLPPHLIPGGLHILGESVVLLLPSLSDTQSLYDSLDRSVSPSGTKAAATSPGSPTVPSMVLNDSKISSELADNLPASSLLPDNPESSRSMPQTVSDNITLCSASPPDSLVLPPQSLLPPVSPPQSLESITSSGPVPSPPRSLEMLTSSWKSSETFARHPHVLQQTYISSESQKPLISPPELRHPRSLELVYSSPLQPLQPELDNGPVKSLQLHASPPKSLELPAWSPEVPHPQSIELVNSPPESLELLVSPPGSLPQSPEVIHSPPEGFVLLASPPESLELLTSPPESLPPQSLELVISPPNSLELLASPPESLELLASLPESPELNPSPTEMVFSLPQSPELIVDSPQLFTSPVLFCSPRQSPMLPGAPLLNAVPLHASPGSPVPQSLPPSCSEAGSLPSSPVEAINFLSLTTHLGLSLRSQMPQVSEVADLPSELQTSEVLIPKSNQGHELVKDTDIGKGKADVRDGKQRAKSKIPVWNPNASKMLHKEEGKKTKMPLLASPTRTTGMPGNYKEPRQLEGPLPQPLPRLSSNDSQRNVSEKDLIALGLEDTSEDHLRVSKCFSSNITPRKPHMAIEALNFSAVSSMNSGGSCVRNNLCDVDSSPVVSKHKVEGNCGERGHASGERMSYGHPRLDGERSLTVLRQLSFPESLRMNNLRAAMSSGSHAAKGCEYVQDSLTAKPSPLTSQAGTFSIHSPKQAPVYNDHKRDDPSLRSLLKHASVPFRSTPCKRSADGHSSAARRSAKDGDSTSPDGDAKPQGTAPENKRATSGSLSRVRDVIEFWNSRTGTSSATCDRRTEEALSVNADCVTRTGGKSPVGNNNPVREANQMHESGKQKEVPQAETKQKDSRSDERTDVSSRETSSRRRRDSVASLRPKIAGVGTVCVVGRSVLREWGSGASSSSVTGSEEERGRLGSPSRRHAQSSHATDEVTLAMLCSSPFPSLIQILQIAIANTSPVTYVTRTRRMEIESPHQHPL